MSECHDPCDRSQKLCLPCEGLGLLDEAGYLTEPITTVTCPDCAGTGDALASLTYNYTGHHDHREKD